MSAREAIMGGGADRRSPDRAAPHLVALVERAGARKAALVADFLARLDAGDHPDAAFAAALEAAVRTHGVRDSRAELLLLARVARAGGKPAIASLLALKRAFGDLAAGSAGAAPPASSSPAAAEPARPAPPRALPPARRPIPPTTRPERIPSGTRRLLTAALTFPLRRRKTCLALLLAGCALHALLWPGFWLGRGTFRAPPPERAEVAARLLEANGYAARRDAAGRPAMLEHRRWPDRLPLAGRWLGRSLLLLAARGTEAAELYAVRLLDTPAGPRLAAPPEPVSRTPEAGETLLAALDDAFAFTTDLGDGIVCITVEDGDFTRRRQFILRGAPPLSGLAPAPLGAGLLLAEGRSAGRAARLLLDPATGAAETGGVAVEWIPPDAGSEPFLPRLVDRVRALPFVGNERVAALEDLYYDVKDRIMVKLYGGEPSRRAGAVGDTETADAGDDEGAPAPAATEPPAVAAGRPPAVAEDAARPAAAARPALPAPSLARGLALCLRAAREAIPPLCSGLAGAYARARAAAFAGPTDGPAPAWDGPARPPDIAPLIERPARKGEGVWSDEGLPQPPDGPAFFTTTLRPDPARPFSVLHLASFDLARIDLTLIPGTEEPASPKGLRGRGKVPDGPGVRRLAVALFNGGFRTKHGRFGFIAGGLPFLQPTPGLATVAVEPDGRVRMGTFGHSLDPARPYLHLRQNLPPLVERGRINRKQRYWGAALNNATHVWRSALGVTADGRRLVYGAGNALSHETLARGMIAAGCAYAMQLDINDYHTWFHILAPRGGDGGDLEAKKLAEDMHSERRRGLTPYTRDFFLVTWKAAPAHLADE